MELEIKLFSDLKRYAPGSKNVFSISITSGATVDDALKALKVPEDVPKVTILNGRRADTNTIIEPQSILVVFSSVSGG